MLNSIIKLIIGDLEGKRAYRRFMKRVNAMPKEYRFAFRKIQHYMYTVGPLGSDLTTFTDLTIFSELVDLLEASAAEGRQVLDVIGSDVGKFTDEFMHAMATNVDTRREKLNNEVMKKLKKEGR